MNKGKIVQVMGPVVDVVFEDGNLPNTGKLQSHRFQAECRISRIVLLLFFS